MCELTCEVCGHKGNDVEWQETNRPGYYCKDQKACFLRYQEKRLAPPHRERKER